MANKVQPKKHPAVFPTPIKNAIRRVLVAETARNEHVPFVCDPYAGIGGIHDIWPHAVGIELEPEWASQGIGQMLVGSALDMPYPNCHVEVIATSVCWGNRMADHHNAKDKHRPCKGKGCSGCYETGLSDRITYRHRLGRMPSEGSAAVMHWGKPYRRHHRAFLKECMRVLMKDGLLVINIGDYINKGQRIKVSKWWHQAAVKAGFIPEQKIQVHTRKMRKGANREVRVPYEWVLCFRKQGGEAFYE